MGIVIFSHLPGPLPEDINPTNGGNTIAPVHGTGIVDQPSFCPNSASLGPTPTRMRAGLKEHPKLGHSQALDDRVVD